MSDLEQQAASWVPPWQRPAAPTSATSPIPAPTQEDTEPDPQTDAAADGTAGKPAAGQAAPDGQATADKAGHAADGVEVENAVPPADGAAASGKASGSGRASADGASAGTGEPSGGAGGASAGAGEASAGAEGDADGDGEAGGGKPSKRKAKAVNLLAAAVPGQRGPAAAGPAADGQTGGAAEDQADDQDDDEDDEDDGLEPIGINEADIVPAIEAILMVVDEPLSELSLAHVLGLPAEDVANALIDLSAAYTREKRGFDLRRAAGGWRFYTRAEYAPYVERFVLDGQQLRLTQASLETLAVVAYKQPVTRSRIAAIRGVNVDGVIRTLVSRGMIEECGSDPESGAHLYRTTTLFLEKMGLDSVGQLPPLAPFLPDNLEEIANGE